MVAELPHPRRVVTGHDSSNKAIFVADGEVAPAKIADTLDFAVLYETHEFPADNSQWNDPIKNRTDSLANKDGVVLRVVDFKPNNRIVSAHNLSTGTKGSVVLIKAPKLFHRTESLDFGIITKGEIICRLDDGVEKTLRAGDVCVQRGTIHSWENRTDETCRVTFVLIAAKMINEELGSAGFVPEEMASGGEQ